MRLLSWIAPGRSKFKLTLFNVYFASHHVRSGGLGTRSPSMKGTFESGDNREEKKKKKPRHNLIMVAGGASGLQGGPGPQEGWEMDRG